jgi:hypothetical protein
VKTKLALLFLLACACAGHVTENNRTPINPPSPEECVEYQPPDLLEPTPRAFPVEVLIDTNTSNHNISLILDAIDAWNTRIGEEILYATISADLAGMHGMCNYTTVTTNVNLQDPLIGLTTYGPCAADHVDIETMDIPGNDTMACFFTDLVVTQIAIHELGHVLGLPHEQDPKSVMYPTIGQDVRIITDRSACLVEFVVSRSRS